MLGSKIYLTRLSKIMSKKGFPIHIFYHQSNVDKDLVKFLTD